MSDNPVGGGDGRIMSVAGYQVFQAGDDGAPPIKEEPFDPEYQVALNTSGVTASIPVHQPAPISGLSGPSSMEESAAGLFDSLSSQKIRDILKNVLDNKSRELTVKNVVESLLQRNENVLSQNNLQSLKPSPRTIKPKPNGATDPNETSIGSTTIVPPRSPTSCCSIPKDDIAHISHALVEEPVIGDNGEKVNNSLRLDMVCAVGSKVMLMTSGGQSLAMDITCYWCNFCSYRSERKEALLQHIMEHRFHCKYCKYQSFSRADVIRHCNKEHDMFSETAKTLKYCTFLPDYLQAGMIREDNEIGKRKAESNLDSEPNAKLAKTSEEKKAVGKGARNTKAKDEEYEAFDMEVDEVDEGPGYPDVEGDEQDESETKVISPKKTPVPVSSVPITHVISCLAPAQALTVQSLPVLAPAPVQTFVSNPILSSVLGQAGQPVVGLVGQPLLATTSQPIISSVHSIATSHSTSGPFITNVISGQQAVAAATAEAEPITPPAPAPSSSEPVKKQSVVTVSSGLCWNCGYCNFVTLSQSYLKIHLNAKHQGKAHKYVAMLVSSEEEMKRIKKSDAEMMNAPPGGGMVTVGGTNVTTPSYTLPSSSQVVIDNAEKVSGERDEGISEEEKKKIPQTYKCAHCNFSATQYDRVKSHLLLRHQSSVMYALDMKAVKLRQKRYLFFCLKKDCEFSTKDLEDFTNHTDECTPWLDGNQDDIDTGLIKALELTRQFAAKVAGNALLGQKDHRSEKTAEYGCYYCSYVSNNNTRVKKHVLSNHKDRSPMIKDLMGDKKSKPTVYFCSYCLWESRDGSELEIHLRERHNDVTEAEKHKNPPAQQSPSPNNVDENSSSSPFLSTASSASSENDDDDQGDLDFDGNIPEEEREKAMEAYITDEASRDMQSGRPVRASAIRAQVKVRAHGHTPTLYMCIHCQEIAFGANLIRKHIRNMHKKLPLRAIDVKRKINHQHNLTCICPKEGCQFVSQDANEMVTHASKEHSLTKSDPDLTKLQEKFVPPTNVLPNKGNTPKNSTTEVYECLYCSTSLMFHSKSDIKEHMLVKHSNEEFIYRDVVAWKNKQASRFYLCVSDQCCYSTTEQKDYTIHTLAHQNAHIYECAKCQWFTAERNLVSEHVKQMHPGEQVTTMEIDLTVDSNGEVVKMVGGTIIKQEM